MKISLVFTTSQSAFRIKTLNLIFFIAVKILKMEEFTNFDLFFDLLLPAEVTDPDTTSGYI
jgi:hypothetical protein